MTLQIQKLRPGLVVDLSTSIKGKGTYRRFTTEASHVLENGQSTREQWETTKVVTDATEHEAATKVRGKCRSVVTAVCAASPNGGLLCLQANRDKLDAALDEARKLAAEFNSTATITRISVAAWIGEIGSDDAE